MIRLRVEQRLHGRLDGEGFHAARLHAGALHGVAKCATELARPRAEIEQPVGFAGRVLGGERAMLPELVVHAEHRNADRFGFVHELLETCDPLARLDESGRENRRIDAIGPRRQRGTGQKQGQERTRKRSRYCAEAAEMHRLPRVPKRLTPFKPGAIRTRFPAPNCTCRRFLGSSRLPAEFARTRMSMDWLTDPEAWIALLTLTSLEIVLGVDNVVFLAILAGKLPPEQRERARFIGLGLAMFLRIALLLGLGWVMRLTAPLFTVLEHAVSGRDLILIGGGLFLIAKSTYEIHHKMEDPKTVGATGHASFASILIQILILDMVFSLDSVITAVGMADDIGVMVTAVVIAVAFMMVFAGKIGHFVEKHPTVKMLALSFLLLIGTALVADGLHQHIPKGYIYFAMGFSVLVEALNLRAGSRHAVHP